VRRDRSVLDLLTADDTFVNERLATHYGMPASTGARSARPRGRRAPRPARQGRHPAGHLARHHDLAGAARQVDSRQPARLAAAGPPPDVPALAENDPAAPRTMREQLERHRANPSCAACHKLMDPIGFALENFDAVGAWRAPASRAPARHRDVLADGTPVDGVDGLRAALAARPDVFVRTFVEKLMTYALGPRARGGRHARGARDRARRAPGRLQVLRHYPGKSFAACRSGCGPRRGPTRRSKRGPVRHPAHTDGAE
jgi:hypothetical protein